MNRLLALVCLTLLGACATPADTAAERPAIDVYADVIDAYATAWRADDVEGVLALLADDAVLMPHHGDPRIVGRDAIRQHWFPRGTSGIELTHYEFEVLDAASDGDLGYATGRFEIAFNMDDAGSTMRYENGGNFMMAFRRDADGWRIARYIWNDPVVRPR